MTETSSRQDLTGGRNTTLVASEIIKAARTRASETVSTVIVDDEAVRLTEEGLSSLKVHAIKLIAQSLGLRQSGRKSILVQRVLTYSRTSEGRRDISSHGLNVNCLDPFIKVDRRKRATASTTSQKSTHQQQRMSAQLRREEPPGMGLSSGVASSSPRPSARPPISNCLCGVLSKTQMGSLVECTRCCSQLHALCMRWDAYLARINAVEFVCPRCRLNALDPFYPVVDTLAAAYMHPGLADVTLEEDSDGHHLHMRVSKCIDTFPLHQWRREGKEVLVRSVVLGTPQNGQMQLQHDWPRSLTIKVKDNTESIVPPRPDHKRRDTPLTISHFLKPELNRIEFIGSEILDERGETPSYMIGVLLCDTVDASQLVDHIIQKSLSITFAAGVERVCQLMRATASVEDDELECVERNQRFKLTCPITLTRMKHPARGSECCHLQCFDLDSFVQVTKSSKAFNNRWKCPECVRILRNDVLMVDPYVTEILKHAPNDAEVVEVAGDGSYSFVQQSEKIGVASSDDESDAGANFSDNEDAARKHVIQDTSQSNGFCRAGSVFITGKDIIDLSDDDDARMNRGRSHCSPLAHPEGQGGSTILPLRTKSTADFDDSRLHRPHDDPSLPENLSLTLSSLPSMDANDTQNRLHGRKRRRLSGPTHEQPQASTSTAASTCKEPNSATAVVSLNDSIDVQIIELSPSSCSSTEVTEPESDEDRPRKRRRTMPRSPAVRWDEPRHREKQESRCRKYEYSDEGDGDDLDSDVYNSKRNGGTRYRGKRLVQSACECPTGRSYQDGHQQVSRRNGPSDICHRETGKDSSNHEYQVGRRTDCPVGIDGEPGGTAGLLNLADCRFFSDGKNQSWRKEAEVESGDRSMSMRRTCFFDGLSQTLLAQAGDTPEEVPQVITTDRRHWKEVNCCNSVVASTKISDELGELIRWVQSLRGIQLQALKQTHFSHTTLVDSLPCLGDWKKVLDVLLPSVFLPAVSHLSVGTSPVAPLQSADENENNRSESFSTFLSTQSAAVQDAAILTPTFSYSDIVSSSNSTHPISSLDQHNSCLPSLTFHGAPLPLQRTPHSLITLGTPSEVTGRIWPIPPTANV